MKLRIKTLLSMLIACMAVIICTGCTSKEKVEQWTITQYGRPENSQYMFYTIEDTDNNLIIIDGGHNNDIEVADVRSVIERHNNHVVAWIITHPHPDHVGAFNVIANDFGDIAVNDIYVTDVNSERYHETAQDYDDIGAYDEFLRVTEGMDNIHYLHEGDTFECLGLTFDVLHAWDEETDALPDHLANNGSICFVVKANEESMLFCSDVQDEMQQFIIDRHKDELDVDYVQLGHHGNWGMTTEFYDYINPKAVFFDASDFLFDPENTKYDALSLWDYFQNRGVTTYRFSTAPNQIIIR